MDVTNHTFTTEYDYNQKFHAQVSYDIFRAVQSELRRFLMDQHDGLKFHGAPIPVCKEMLTANTCCKYQQDEAGTSLGTKTHLTMLEGDVAKEFFLKWE